MSVDSGPLRRLLEAAKEQHGHDFNDLTVLDNKNDPFRIDTPARHRDGKWFSEIVQSTVGQVRRLHLRGFHYVLLGATKPNGKPYTNTFEDWTWLQGKAADAARWLGYLPFTRIIDERNTAPVERIWTPSAPEPWISNPHVSVSLPYSLNPEIYVRDEEFIGRQPVKIVLIGEKTSLETVLGPEAEAYQADLYLPTGEISETQIHHLMQMADVDGRPLVIFYFTDCDPSGWQMPISVVRKLQGHQARDFPDVVWEAYHVGLLPEHVIAEGLPSTPLKPSERRADDWVEKMGVEQTEIDAIATLRPQVLRRMVREALDLVFDDDLETRVAQARVDWLTDARRALAEHVGATDEERRRELLRRMGDLDTEAQAIQAELEALHVEIDDVDLPPIEVPDGVRPEVGGKPPIEPFASSEQSFIELSLALKARKRYEL